MTKRLQAPPVEPAGIDLLPGLIGCQFTGIRGTPSHPLDQGGDLVGGERGVWGHGLPVDPLPNGGQEQTRFGIARDNRRPRPSSLLPAAADIKRETTAYFSIVGMAVEAAFPQQRLNPLPKKCITICGRGVGGRFRFADHRNGIGVICR